MLLESKELDITNIIEAESVVMRFQPIVSIKKNSIIGLEALCRGVLEDTIIPPDILFKLAAKESLTVELDRLCRKKAIESFSRIRSDINGLMLFVNIDASIIDKGVVGSGYLLNLVNKFNINPNNIAIEINESKSNDIDSLKQFIDIYRGHGFIIALDDVGAGHSNLNRLSIVKPDILKVDMHLIRDIDKEFHKQEVLKSLVSLSKKIGALVVAEGVEREEEAIIALDFGVDMLQGFYFSQPREIDCLLANQFDDKKEYIAKKLKRYAIDRVIGERLRMQEFEIIANEVIYELAKTNFDSLGCKLEEMINDYLSVECMYVLDDAGVQVSETVCNYSKFSNYRRPIFRPAPRGTDHSLKNYYYLIIGMGLDKYITEPYISLASGNLCITVSKMYKDDAGNIFIICMDVSFN